MTWRDIAVFGPLVYAVLLTLVYFVILAHNTRAEDQRRKRFPKRVFQDGELAYEVTFDGYIVAAPRWELRIEPDGMVNVQLKTPEGKA